MTHRVSFVADLHLFTRRSDAPRYLEAIEAAAGRSAALVLGGDIFDFRWSTLGTTTATIEAATQWLEDLAARHPQCHIHYLLGNHDYCRAFVERLKQRTCRHCGKIASNLSWHPFFLRLGDHLFLHGDVAERRMTNDSLIEFRSRWAHGRPAGRFHRRAYDMFFRTGLHRPIPYLVHTKRRVARRIHHYLEHVGHGPHSGVRHVYFGHLHRRVLAYRYRGMTFHNGGAPVGGQKFRILETMVEM